MLNRTAMGGFNKFLAVFTIILTMSCDLDKNNSPAHSDSEILIPKNIEQSKTTIYESKSNLDELIGTTARNDWVNEGMSEHWNLDHPKRKENLFEAFSMTEDQIQSYENALQAWKESENDDAFKLLSATAKIKEEDRILRAILNESQYGLYIEWSMNNHLGK
ncbi:hypothetical protein [Gelidibacter sp. F63206]|uniref:hypothetical protein n=1 Tax=Gelidibacter sp. F63206 TaxID=2926425 RepID=UPI001FF4DB5D|nr:hypothetical protein [Gelidibacter sp. F63206]MCK0114753.1 hypothetical protein [Gelidibacter sp. F63206]